MSGIFLTLAFIRVKKSSALKHISGKISGGARGGRVNNINCDGLTQSTQHRKLRVCVNGRHNTKMEENQPTPPKAHQLSKVPRGLALKTVTDDLLSYRVLRALHFLDLRDVAA